MVVHCTDMMFTNKHFHVQIVAEALSSTKCDASSGSDHEGGSVQAGLEQDIFGITGIQPSRNSESVGVQARPSVRSARIQVKPNHKTIGKQVPQICSQYH